MQPSELDLLNILIQRKGQSPLNCHSQLKGVVNIVHMN